MRKESARQLPASTFKKRFGLVLIVVAAACGTVWAADRAPCEVAQCARATSEYTYQWWTNGLQDPAKSVSIQTSRYAFQIDVPHLRLTHLMPIARPLSEADTLTQANDAVFGAENASLTISLSAAGKSFRANGASADFRDSHLIEGGKFFQRRTINKIAFAPGAPKAECSLEAAAWPDRLTLWLHVTPQERLERAGMTISVAAGGDFSCEAAPGDGKLESPRKDVWTASVPEKDWPAGEERSVALIFRPVGAGADGEVKIAAEQIAPKRAALEVGYDRVMGWHEVRLRNDVTDAAPHNDRMERVELTLENPAAVAKTVRLCFAKENPFAITGISAMLRDRAGNPTGIPMQISKNWHTNPERYCGPWYRGLTMLCLPPNSRCELEYTSVGAHWGGVPAASHAQLCLVGWGNNQLWEQAAMGAWGETLCFEPDQGQAGGAVLDTRPLMVWAMDDRPNTRWGWTCNVGGADFLVYYDNAGQKQRNSRMRTRHVRNGPVLTEATYAGVTHDGNIELQYTASLYRTDDIARGVYRFRYDVRKATPFSRLVLFQCGGDDYSYTGERKFALGDRGGLMREWETTWGGGEYRTAAVEFAGPLPWASMHEAVPRAQRKEAWANRGLVIRQWDARLGGRPARPWVAERGAHVRGADTSLMDILPPGDLHALEPGDFVEAVIEHIVVPQRASDYYGPNEPLRAALEKDGNTWRMIRREAVGNDVHVDVACGKALRSRPLLIAADKDRAEFALCGGLGYVPVTIAGVTEFARPRLETFENGQWRTVDQSVQGNDFYQADFQPGDGTWQFTYSLPCDTPDDRPVVRRFRFSVPRQ